MSANERRLVYVLWGQYGDKSGEQFMGVYESLPAAESIQTIINQFGPSMEVKITPGLPFYGEIGGGVIPGIWQCPKCKFGLCQSVIHSQTGAVAPRHDPGELCPNCCVTLHEVTYRDMCDSLNQRIGEEMTANQRLRVQRTELLELLSEWQKTVPDLTAATPDFIVTLALKTKTIMDRPASALFT